MNKRWKYYVKQKLMGVLLIALGVIMAALDGWDITALLLILPIGLLMIFTKEKVWIDNYDEDEGEES